MPTPKAYLSRIVTRGRIQSQKTWCITPIARYHCMCSDAVYIINRLNIEHREIFRHRVRGGAGPPREADPTKLQADHCCPQMVRAKAGNTLPCAYSFRIWECPSQGSILSSELLLRQTNCRSFHGWRNASNRSKPCGV
jgi:hypothetical protein